MDESRFEGTARNFGGKVQDAVGGLTGDAAVQGRGKVNEALGSAQNASGKALDEVTGFTSEQPVAALLAAMGVGVAVGFLLGRS